MCDMSWEKLMKEIFGDQGQNGDQYRFGIVDDSTSDRETVAEDDLEELLPSLMEYLFTEMAADPRHRIDIVYDATDISEAHLTRKHKNGWGRMMEWLALVYALANDIAACSLADAAELAADIHGIIGEHIAGGVFKDLFTKEDVA